MNTEEEFELLYKSTYKSLLDYASIYLKKREVLEELLQETFWDVYISMPKTMAVEKGYAWVFECFRHNLREVLLKEGSYKREVSYEAVMDKNMTDGFDFTEQIIDRQLLSQIAKEGELKSLYLQYVEGHSVAEMAKLLNMTEGQYRMRVCRLRKKLVKNLKEVGYEEVPKKKKKK